MMAKAKKKEEHWLILAFDIGHWSRTLDKAIDKAVGRLADGSGAGLGARDMDWKFRSRFAAQGAADKIRKVFEKAGIDEDDFDVRVETR